MNIKNEIYNVCCYQQFSSISIFSFTYGFADFFIACLAVFSLMFRFFWNFLIVISMAMLFWSYNWIFFKCQDLSNHIAEHLRNSPHLTFVDLPLRHFSTALTSLFIQANIIP